MLTDDIAYLYIRTLKLPPIRIKIRESRSISNTALRLAAYKMYFIIKQMTRVMGDQFPGTQPDRAISYMYMIFLFFTVKCSLLDAWEAGQIDPGI